MVNNFKLSYYYLYKNRSYFDEETYKVVKYEDLVENTEEVMKELCYFLELGYMNEVVTPTLIGKEWLGNSASGKKFKEVSNASINRWQKEIFPNEIYLINKNFSFILDKFNYEFVPYKKGYWKKNKGENFKRYFINRLYKYYQ